MGMLMDSDVDELRPNDHVSSCTRTAINRCLAATKGFLLLLGVGAKLRCCRLRDGRHGSTVQRDSSCGRFAASLNALLYRGMPMHGCTQGLGVHDLEQWEVGSLRTSSFNQALVIWLQAKKLKVLEEMHRHTWFPAISGTSLLTLLSLKA